MSKSPERERNVLKDSSFEKSQRLISNKFFARMRLGNRTKEENPQDHFCVYFAAFDLRTKEVFIGYHKKSGLWLFNGGHPDKGESPVRALRREMLEEWGLIGKVEGNGGPSLRTITEVNNKGNPCKVHYDYWYFVPVDKFAFRPEKELLDKEFHTTGWKSINEAIALIKDPNTLVALEQIQKRF